MQPPTDLPRRRARPARAARAFARALAAALALAALAAPLAVYAYRHRPRPRPAIERLAPGVAYAREVLDAPRPIVVHLVTIELATSGLRFLVTPGEPARALPLDARTTSGFVRESGALLAINGDFFAPWHSEAPWDYYPHAGDPVRPLGRACSEGACYAPGAGDGSYSLFLSPDGRAAIAASPPDGLAPFNVISGGPLLIGGGAIVPNPGVAQHPRTAVGLDASGRTLMLAVVDGRQPNYSEGVTLLELSALLRERGAHVALNLDGGGSSALARRRPSGEVELLNCPISNRIPYRERPVANHLALFAAPP
ncbi:MAG TPA: phosphodiester glycosidase family protein [Polyangiaceae bacterium]|nr:phosphodiester glycosidase family protein [Polyangiaceae bacterium]